VSKKKVSDPKSTPGLVPVRLMLDPEDRDWLKVVAAHQGESMAGYVENLALAAVVEVRAELQRVYGDLSDLLPLMRSDIEKRFAELRREAKPGP
jgi:hypothetical protein